MSVFRFPLGEHTSDMSSKILKTIIANPYKCNWPYKPDDNSYFSVINLMYVNVSNFQF